MDEDGQALEEPIIAPVKKKQVEVREKEALHMNVSAEYLKGLMGNPNLVRNITVAGQGAGLNTSPPLFSSQPKSFYQLCFVSSVLSLRPPSSSHQAHPTRGAAADLKLVSCKALAPGICTTAKPHSWTCFWSRRTRWTTSGSATTSSCATPTRGRALTLFIPFS